MQPRPTNRNHVDNGWEMVDWDPNDQNEWDQSHQNDGYQRRPMSQGRRVTIWDQQEEDPRHNQSQRHNIPTPENYSSNAGGHQPPARDRQPSSSRERHRSTIPGNNRSASAGGSSSRSAPSPQGAAANVQRMGANQQVMRWIIILCSSQISCAKH